jgi:hypothetical protein
MRKDDCTINATNQKRSHDRESAPTEHVSPHFLLHDSHVNGQGLQASIRRSFAALLPIQEWHYCQLTGLLG